MPLERNEFKTRLKSAKSFMHSSSISRLYFINSTTFSLWWIALNPGFYSADSIGVLNRVANGELSSEWTYLWDVLVYVFTIGGVYPHFGTLAFGLILVFSFTFFCVSFFAIRTAWLVSILVSNTPIVFGLGLTLWHDVPMTSGLLLFTASIKRTLDTGRLNLGIFLVSFILVNTRLNGFWTALFTLLILVSIKRISIRPFIKMTIYLVLVTAPATILNYVNLTNENTQISGLTHWMKYDISCYISGESRSKLEIEEKLIRENLTPRDLVSASACNWFMDPNALASWSSANSESIVRTWMLLFRSDGLSILKIHENRAEYLIFNPFRIPSKPPFLHTTIESENPWVREWNPTAYQIARSYPRFWNAIYPLTAYAGFWLFFIFIITLRNSKYFPILVLSTVLNTSIFITAIIADVRYVAFTLIAGVAIALAELCKYVPKRLKQN